MAPVSWEGDCLWCGAECMIRRPAGRLDLPVVEHECFVLRVEHDRRREVLARLAATLRAVHAGGTLRYGIGRGQRLPPSADPDSPAWERAVPNLAELPVQVERPSLAPSTLEERPLRRYKMRSDSPWTREILAEAKWLYYYDGLGFVRIVRRLRRRLPPASTENALANGLHNQFKRLGWPRRERVQATALASWRHGLKPRGGDQTAVGHAYRRARRDRQPRCCGVKPNGERCPRPAITGTEHCPAHGEGSEKRNAEILADARRRRDANLIDAAPFIRLLDELRAELGTWRAVCAIFECDNSMPNRFRAKPTMHPNTIRRYLERGRARRPEIPKFEDLYEEVRCPHCDHLVYGGTAGEVAHMAAEHNDLIERRLADAGFEVSSDDRVIDLLAEASR